MAPVAGLELSREQLGAQATAMRAEDSPEGHEEIQEQPGELPQIAARRSKYRSSRKKEQHIKLLEDERKTAANAVAGVMQEFAENQRQMLELQQQVESMKDREKKKASEVYKWKSNYQTLEKESMMLKKQLAQVTERRTKSELSNNDMSASMRAEQLAADRLAVEHVQMRLADYESLVAQFADETESIRAADMDAWDQPQDLSNHSSLSLFSKSLLQAPHRKRLWCWTMRG